MPSRELRTLWCLGVCNIIQGIVCVYLWRRGLEEGKRRECGRMRCSDRDPGRRGVGEWPVSIIKAQDHWTDIYVLRLSMESQTAVCLPIVFDTGATVLKAGDWGNYLTDHHWPRVSVSLMSRLMANYSRGGAGLLPLVGVRHVHVWNV